MSFRNKGNVFLSSRICSICWQHKLYLEFVLPVCQNQPQFSLWFKSTTSLNSLITGLFPFATVIIMSLVIRLNYSPPHLFFLTVYKQKNISDPKNLKVVQELWYSTRENQTTQRANTFLQFKGTACNVEEYIPLSLFLLLFAIAAPRYQAREHLPFPSILHPHILYLSPQYKIILLHFQWQWVCPTCLVFGPVNY